MIFDALGRQALGQVFIPAIVPVVPVIPPIGTGGQRGKSRRIQDEEEAILLTFMEITTDDYEA